MENSDFPKRIKLILKALELTQSGLASKLGLSQGVISEFASGAREPSKEFLLGLPKLGISLDWFLTGNGEMGLAEKQERKHPLIAGLEAIVDERLEKIEARISEVEKGLKRVEAKEGLYVSEPEPEYGEVSKKTLYVDNVAAGLPIAESEDLTNYIDVPVRLMKGKTEDYYVGRIRGTSMTAAGIPDGCLALFRKADVPRDGGIQIVRCNGEVTLKRIRELPGRGWKICFDDYTGRYIEVQPGDEFQVQGDFIALVPEPEE